MEDGIDRNQVPLWPSGADTSRAAALSIYEVTGRLRRAVFDRIRAAGPAGTTCDAVEADLGGRHQTISARVKELLDMDVIVDSGRRAATRSGRSARVYVADECYQGVRVRKVIP